MAEHVESQTTPDPSVEVGHELSDASAPGILWFGLALVALVVITYLGVSVLFRYFDESEARLKQSKYPLARTELPAQPRLEILDREPPPSRFGSITDPVRKSRPEDLDRHTWTNPVGSAGQVNLIAQALSTQAIGSGGPLAPFGRMVFAGKIAESDALRLERTVQIPIAQAKERFLELLKSNPDSIRDAKERKKYRNELNGTIPSDANSGRGRRKTE